MSGQAWLIFCAACAVVFALPSPLVFSVGLHCGRLIEHTALLASPRLAPSPTFCENRAWLARLWPLAPRPTDLLTKPSSHHDRFLHSYITSANPILLVYNRF
jgi:hypothetical protein